MFKWLVVSLGLLISCVDSHDVPGNARAQPTFPLEMEDPAFFSDPSVVPGGTLRLRVASAPTSFLSYAQHTPANERITQHLLLPLIERHPIDDSLRASLAKNWTYSLDKKELLFELREEHYWSDGVPITSDDVIFTFENLILNPASAANYLEVFSHAGQNVTIERISDKSFRLRLPTPLPAILYTLTYLPILPKHKIIPEQISPENLSRLWSTNTPPTQIVSSGAFVLTDYKIGTKASFVRNPYYFRSDPLGVQLPYVDHMELLVVPHNSQVLAFYLANKLDYLEVNAEEFVYLKSQMEFNKKYDLFKGIPAKSSPSVAHIGFNFDAKDPNKAQLFKNQDFRIAMEHLLNRPLIIEQVYKDFAQIEGTFITPSNKEFYNPASDDIRRPFMPDLALYLLRKIGFTDPGFDRWAHYPKDQDFTLHILVPTGTTTGQESKIAILFAQELGDLGIRTSIETLDQHTVSQRIRDGDFEVVVRSLANSPDPGARVRVYWEPGQFLYYIHRSTYDPQTKMAKTEEMLPWEKELVILYEKANTAADNQRRRSYYDAIQMIYAQYLPVIFTVRQDNLYTSQKSVKNIYMNEAGLLVFSPWTAGKRTSYQIPNQQ